VPRPMELYYGKSLVIEIHEDMPIRVLRKVDVECFLRR
jgi:hypothetical protein